MKERIYITNLYETYKSLLTTKQQLYFTSYYYEDLSLSEISENMSVSKTLVAKTIKQVETKLKDYESKLNLYMITSTISNIIDKPNIKEELTNLINKVR